MTYNKVNQHNLDAEFAYDETQCSDEIESGDTLIAGETVGFMLDAWPVAVTLNAGQFHQVATDRDPEELYKGSEMKPCAIAHAIICAKKLGLEIDPAFANVETE